MALTIFRRHLKSCGQTSRRYRRCKCPIHVQGTLGGEKIRQALDLTSWEAAENLVHEWNRAGKIGAEARRITLQVAVEKFLADGRARSLRPGTLKLLEALLTKQLVPWCAERKIVCLAELDVEKVGDFRGSWGDAPITALKKLERLRSFFRFCVDRDWLPKNPAKAVKSPKVPPNPTLPFTSEEFNALLSACEKFPHNGRHAWNTAKRVRAMVLLLRYSGLRISDAVALHQSRIADGKLFLYAAKTKQPVWCPLPDSVIAEMETIRVGEYYFWTGVGALKSAISSWDRTIRNLGKKADVKDVHFHRFRDTFSVSLLELGVPLEDVAMLLGNTPAIVEKHYAPFVKSRQERLEERVKQTWKEEKPKLKVVKGGG